MVACALALEIPMTKRLLATFALALLACTCAHAAPKKKHPAAKQDAAPTEIDVDAMARAKDGKPTEPLKTDTPSSAAPGEPAPASSGSESTTDGTAPKDSAEPVATPPAERSGTAEPVPADAGAPAVEATAEPAPRTGESDSKEPAQAAAASPAAPATGGTNTPTTGGRPSPLAPPTAPTDIEKSLAAACEARATSLLDAAQKGDYERATRDFDAKMHTALPAAKLGHAWESLAQFGALQARGQAHPSRGDGYIAITIPLIFDKANLYAQVACGSDGRVAGFYVKPL